ncbi:hypothetical protein [Nocardia sp. CY41]|uniref:hypothetical protein n=1 Tax=Nocardia sp. CY41 TaxID=2608686 RepID=UPI00135B59C2|nr:hypothetical protein [Nocardia sp. CY41]
MSGTSSGRCLLGFGREAADLVDALAVPCLDGAGVHVSTNVVKLLLVGSDQRGANMRREPGQPRTDRCLGEPDVRQRHALRVSL